MAGVIDSSGVQFEHCNICGKLYRMANLGYLPPSEELPYGADICISCTNGLDQEKLEKVIPSPSWVPQFSDTLNAC